MNPVLQSAILINKNSKNVSINNEKIHSAALKVLDGINSTEYSTNAWKQHELNPNVANEEAVEWIFVIDLLNFCFWTTKDKKSREYSVSYNGKSYTGYWSLCASINRALDEGIPITDPSYYSKISRNELEYIFRSSSSNQEQIKMLDERLEILNEAGKVLVDKFEGRFVNCLKQANNSSLKLVDLLTTNFPSFDDKQVVQFDGLQTVKFNKRAQILVADIWACFENEGLGKFTDIDSLTMFADYRVPQVLLYLGILEYSEQLYNFLLASNSCSLPKNDLAGKDLNSGVLPSGHIYEIEIRGNSILVVELLRQEINKLLQQNGKPGINSVLLDFYLWDYAKKYSELMDHIPIHLVKSVYY
ncbi:hypothetical protein BB558_007533 [Smittium angustum]|uniref:Queuosine 5'-phosphate N-glycosylase/hydrolase n=1 Tax=Smittium angustum TaxID=133377 RepID=A0A2U1IUY9_SMIAN|nr:hypothetical protein BB558_007533 [Smittium angustum]